MNIYVKLKETAMSVVPVMGIVILLGCTIAPLDGVIMLRFISGGIFVIFGLTLFLSGVDTGILPIGERSGAALTEKRNLPLLLVSAFAIGFIVTVAEPDVQVLAGQVKGVNPSVDKWSLVFMIAGGVGFFVTLGILRTILSIPLNILLTVSYIAVFALALTAPPAFQGVSFDSGGATTGPMTVPFIMALGMGVANVRSKAVSSKDGTLVNKSQEDSFGLTGIASIGPVAAVCLYGLILLGNSDLSSVKESSAGIDVFTDTQGISVFFHIFPDVFMEVLSALAPLSCMAFVFQTLLIKMPPFQVIRMVAGFVLSFIGLVFFLCGAQGGFMPAGQYLGYALGLNASTFTGCLVLVITGLVFGGVVVCAEPAVWVLTEQVEAVSGGTIKRKVLLLALSAGVSVSVALSMLRVLFGFSMWYVLVPGYALSLLLSFICPKLFTGIAFDSGGVASGPMTSTFVLSFALGASSAAGGNPATDAFGVIAFVAMTPLIAIQILGIMFNIKNKKVQSALKESCE